MKYGDSMVAALVLNHMLNCIKILENIDEIYDNERCSILLNSLQYSAGCIAEELTRPDGNRIASGLIALNKNVIKHLNNDMKEVEAVKLAVLEGIEKLESFAKLHEDNSLMGEINEHIRKINELKTNNEKTMSFIRERGMLEEYIEFINEKGNS